MAMMGMMTQFQDHHCFVVIMVMTMLRLCVDKLLLGKCSQIWVLKILIQFWQKLAPPVGLISLYVVLTN